MIEQELLFLGLLKEKPKHGYEIKKEIKELLSLSAGLDLKSIYYPLQILEKKGLVTKRLIKEGRRPQRLVYALTPKGEERFSDLLTGSILNFKRPQFSLDLSLYFLHYLNPRMSRRRLKARIFILEKISKGLGQMTKSLNKRKPLSLHYILKHNLHMVESEAEFLRQLIKAL